MSEEIISRDGLKVLRLSELMNFYEELGLERFPIENLHIRNFSQIACQYSPQVQDPIVSFSSKSIVLRLNSEQVCKIRLDGKSEQEFHHHTYLAEKTILFPRLDGKIKFKNGLQGIIMERLKIMSKWNFSSGELNGMYYRFIDEIKNLHDLGVVHDDLGINKSTNCRPNIVLTDNKIRLIDCESTKFKETEKDWESKMNYENDELKKYFLELIDFHCETLT